MRSTVLYALLGVIAATGLTACGSSSGDDNEFSSQSIIQFYNGSANSAQTTLRGTELTRIELSASYGDASSAIDSVDGGVTEIEFLRIDSDDQEIIIETRDIDIPDGKKTLVVLNGDFDSPTFNEYRFDRKSDLDNHFRLFAVSVTADQSNFDLHMSVAGAPFSEANFLGSIAYENFEELVYWAPSTNRPRVRP